MEQPSLTPLGQQLMSQNKPLGKFSPQAPTILTSGIVIRLEFRRT